MPRIKARSTSVDLTGTMKAAKTVGLVITYTRIDPDGSITLGHGAKEHGAQENADDVLLAWQENRRRS